MKRANNMLKGIYHSLTERKRQHKKSFAVLVDPDKVNAVKLDKMMITIIGQLI